MQNIHPGNSDTQLRTKHHRPQQCISKFSIARQSDCSQATSRKTNKAASSTFFQAPRRVLLRQTNPPSEGAEPNGDKFRSYLQNLNRTLNATVFQGLCSVTSLHTNLHTTTLFRRATGKQTLQTRVNNRRHLSIFSMYISPGAFVLAFLTALALWGGSGTHCCQPLRHPKRQRASVRGTPCTVLKKPLGHQEDA